MKQDLPTSNTNNRAIGRIGDYQFVKRADQGCQINQVRAILKIFDDRPLAHFCKFKNVAACSTDKAVSITLADQSVGTRPTIQSIGPAASREIVIAKTSRKIVFSALSKKEIVTVVPENEIISVLANKQVSLFSSENEFAVNGGLLKQAKAVAGIA